MGCFSFLCKECGKAILSDSFNGEKVVLFHIVNGRTVQMMEGRYNSYGSVFIDHTKGPEAIEWESDWTNEHFDSEHNGMAAIHLRCWDGDYPTERSADDPNQGWGDDCELLGDTNLEMEFD